MSRRRSRLFLGSLFAPFVVVAACGGDDVLFPVVDAGPDATAADGGGDGTVGDSDVHVDGEHRDVHPVDAPFTVDAQETGVVDTGTDTGTDSPPDVGTDSNPSADAGSDSPVDSGVPISDSSIDVQVFDGGTCNTLANGGAAIPEIQIAQTLNPSGTGGSIAPGLYYLTGWQTYTGPGGAVGASGNTRKTAFYFYATTYLKVTADNGGGDENDNRNWSLAPGDPTTLVSDQTCPTVDHLTSFFTVSGTTLTLSAGSTVLTFVHQ